MSTAKFNQWQNPDGTENYKCRAWVNFNSVGTLAIRASGNVSSVTDNGVGDFIINFTAAFPDTSFAAVVGRAYSTNYNAPTTAGNDCQIGAKTTTSQRVFCGTVTSAGITTFAPNDPFEVNVAFFR